MGRAERRARTERVRTRRVKQWDTAMGDYPWPMARKGCRSNSPFDCGKTECGVCADEHRYSTIGERDRLKQEQREMEEQMNTDREATLDWEAIAEFDDTYYPY